MRAPANSLPRHQNGTIVAARARRWRAFSLLLGSFLASAAGLSRAQPPADIDTPAGRAAYVERLTAEHEAAKADAEVWALQHGMPLYDNDGYHIRELMTVLGGRPVYYTTRNVQSATSIATDRVRDILPWDLNGEGWAVGVWDAAGVRASHQEFVGPDGQSRIKIRDSAVTSAHSTHVAGTIAALGVNPSARGMAPGARIESYDWDNDTAQMFARAATGPGQPNSIYVSNHSYGYSVGWEYIASTATSGHAGWHWTGDWAGANSREDWFGQYNPIARQWDEVGHLNPYYLAFAAAGNDRTDGPAVGETVYYYARSVGWRAIVYSPDTCPPGDGQVKKGYDTISGPAVAKNIVTVGAVHDALAGMTRSCTRAAMTRFSCWGPTDDGRIKPDIVANGTDIYSCDHDSNQDYDTYSGTSMASPAAAGSAILLVQHYARLFPGQAMRSSTLKGLILHTADDLGTVGPDYEYGWGLMNTRAALELIQEHRNSPVGPLMIEDSLDNQNPVDSYYLYTDGTEPVRITLCWTDPPAAAIDSLDNSSPCLIHDLDLRLIGPGGAPTFHPYVLDPANPDKPASTGENRLDNVEQIYLPVPDRQGLYEVRVTCDGKLDGDRQHYSLVSSVPLSNQRPPVAESAQMVIAKDTPATITLKTTDDGWPQPPGTLTCMIASLPRHGTLEDPGIGPIAQPTALTQNANQVIYRPNTGFTGEDSFTFYADDGGRTPFGGPSNTVIVTISVKELTTREYEVSAGEDDATAAVGYQLTSGRFLWVGQNSSAVRFRAIDIPHDAMIVSSYLKVYATSISQANGAIHAEATGDAADFRLSNSPVYDRPRTQASVAWNWTGNERGNVWHSSPNLKEVVEEVIGRSDWSAGNAIAIIYVGKNISGQGMAFASWEAQDEAGFQMASAPDRIGKPAPPEPQYAYAARLEITFALKSGDGPTAPPGHSAPTTANMDLYASANTPVLVTLEAADDGLPAPLSFTLDSLPGDGSLEYPDRTPIAQPGVLSANQVVYRPRAGFTGDDAFTFHADDGGSAPSGGNSNVAAVNIRVRNMVTRQYQVIVPEDDAYGAEGSAVLLSDLLSTGRYDSAMRFQNVDLLPASEVISARLRINIDTPIIEKRLDGLLQAQAVGNADDFAVSVLRISDLLRTQANIPWTWQAGDSWPVGTFRASPDIGAVIQEVIDGPDWLIDNSLVVLYSGDKTAGQDLQFYACDSPYSGQAAKLEITCGLKTAAILPPTVNQTLPEAADAVTETPFNTALTVTLSATDDGLPNPPGRLTYMIASLPDHGILEYPQGGQITAPGALPGFSDQVIYRPATDFMGPDGFAFYANDGAMPQSSGESNVAVIKIMVRPPLTQKLTSNSKVNKSEDDAFSTLKSTSNNLTDPVLKVGLNSSGMRFTGIDIPQGSKIIEARLNVHASTSWLSQGIAGIIQAEAAGDAASFSGADRLVSGLPLTDAFVDWIWTPGSYRQWRASPDISRIIQELIDRPDWTAGNAVAIVFRSQNLPWIELEFSAYDNSPDSPIFAPSLSITYAPNEGTQLPAPARLPGKPPTAANLAVGVPPDAPAIITLAATDDGLPNPPGRLAYAIVSLPQHGTLEDLSGIGIAEPGLLNDYEHRVLYRPEAGFLGYDGFKFCADDGSDSASGGRSNTATMMIFVRKPKTIVTREFQVSAREDDAFANRSASPTGELPNYAFDNILKISGELGMGVRFTDVNIPRGSRIFSARLKMHLGTTRQPGYLEGIIQAEASHDARNFVGHDRYIHDLPRTQASVPWIWDKDKDWPWGVWTTSPELRTVVQEIVDLPGWTEGNAIVLLYTDKEYEPQNKTRVEFYSFEGDPARAPKLEVIFEY